MHVRMYCIGMSPTRKVASSKDRGRRQGGETRGEARRGGVICRLSTRSLPVYMCGNVQIVKKEKISRFEISNPRCRRIQEPHANK